MKKVCQVTEDESNHCDAEQESLLEHRNFKWIQITFILRKNRGYIKYVYLAV